MKGDTGHFESFATRLGLQIEEASPKRISLIWRGGRFPGFICLGIALALLVLSVPIGTAIHSQGWTGTAASMWYFPVMDALLFGVACFLISLKRRVIVDQPSCRVIFTKKSLWKRRELTVDFNEIECLKIGTDLVYSGPALAGSTAGQRFFPANALRLVLKDNRTVLLDRGNTKGIQALAQRLATLVQKPIVENEN